MKTIRMPREMHQKWDKALRSGEYKQGRGTLFNPKYGSYCCLGVLQKAVAGATEESALPSLKWLANHGIAFKTPGAVEGQAPWLPTLDAVASEANDFRGCSFVQIADAIADCVEYTD